MSAKKQVLEVFVKSENVSIISLEYVQKWKSALYIYIYILFKKKIIIYLTYFTVLQSLNLIG